MQNETMKQTCLRKKSYESLAQAVALRTSKRSDPMQPYACPVGPHFHVGHKIGMHGGPTDRADIGFDVSDIVPVPKPRPTQNEIDQQARKDRLARIAHKARKTESKMAEISERKRAHIEFMADSQRAKRYFSAPIRLSVWENEGGSLCGMWQEG